MNRGAYVAALLRNWHKLRTKPEHVSIYTSVSTWPDGTKRYTLNVVSEGRPGALLALILTEADMRFLVAELTSR